jgi:hypothetical protein
MIHDRLADLRDHIDAAVSGLALVQVHQLDMSDTHTGKWLVRLPAVYLIARGARRDEPGMMAAQCAAYVIARFGDLKRQQATQGWELAQLVFAIISARPDAQRVVLRYVDEIGLDQPGIGLWEIAWDMLLRMPTIDPLGVPCNLLEAQADEAWVSWAPLIGAANVSYYQRVEGQPEPGESIEDLVP